MGAGSKKNLIFWITTLSLCPCLRCKKVYELGKSPFRSNICCQKSLEAWNHREARPIYGWQYVKCFKLIAGFDAEYCQRVLHILDSLPARSSSAMEAAQLQMIFLEHFEGATFQLGRVAVNLAQVFWQLLFINFDSLSYSGPTSRERQRLRLLHHLFCQKVSSGPSRHLGNH